MSAEAKSWSIAFGPSIEVRREGEPFRFRTRQQLLLFARLTTSAEGSLNRAEAAAALWPEANPADARTYLRRAVMEMKAADVPLVADRETISLDLARIESDFDDEIASGNLGSSGEKLAVGWDLPILSEMRKIVRSRSKRVGELAPTDEEQADRFVLSLLGDALIRHAPEQAMAIVAQHRYDFYTKAPEADILRFLERLCGAVTEPSIDRAAVLCIRGGIAGIQTHYHSADEFYREAIREAEALGALELVGRAYAMRCTMLIEWRHWEEARESSERAVEFARRSGSHPDIAFALNSLAAYQCHTKRYDESIRSYLNSIDLAEPGPHRAVPMQNMAFVWGVMGGHMDNPPPMPSTTPKEGGYHASGHNYELFSLGIGHGKYREAAIGAAGVLALAAQSSMDRIIAVGLDNAAIAFAKLGFGAEAAASVRVGTRLRRELEHPRSPMELDAVRKHVPDGYFGGEIREWTKRWSSPEPTVSAERVAARLRLCAKG